VALRESDFLRATRCAVCLAGVLTVVLLDFIFFMVPVPLNETVRNFGTTGPSCRTAVAHDLRRTSPYLFAKAGSQAFSGNWREPRHPGEPDHPWALKVRCETFGGCDAKTSDDEHHTAIGLGAWLAPSGTNRGNYHAATT
jgi:hypothetical protein